MKTIPEPNNQTITQPILTKKTTHGEGTNTPKCTTREGARCARFQRATCHVNAKTAPRVDLAAEVPEGMYRARCSGSLMSHGGTSARSGNYGEREAEVRPFGERGPTAVSCAG